MYIQPYLHMFSVAYQTMAIRNQQRHVLESRKVSLVSIHLGLCGSRKYTELTWSALVTDSILFMYFTFIALQYDTIGSILNPLAGNFSEDTRKKGKGAKTRASHDWQSFYLSQYDWLKGSHMTKVVWLPNETDYSYCDFVAPNTPYFWTFSYVLLNINTYEYAL